MAIIKCPECGNQISDKAPVCPNCGVEIAGKVVTCAHCNEVYLAATGACPKCHQPSMSNTVSAGTPSVPPVPPQSQMPPVPPIPPQEPKTTPKKNSTKLWAFSFIFALIVCGGVFILYHNASSEKEQEAYEYAMQSNDPAVLQSYLDNYKDASQEHIDSINAHLKNLNTIDNEWTNALVSGSKEALESYLQKYPDSPHKQEAWNKIDSIDWQKAKSADTADAYQVYLDAHIDGAHIEEAEDAMRKAKSRDLQPEEKDMVSQQFRRFFQGINARDEYKLTDCCADVLSSLLGKPQATRNDVITFMNKLYKEDISNLNWRLNNDYQIKKREVGDEEYEYQVTFTAREEVTHTDGSTVEGNFKFTSTLQPDGKISSLNMSRINAE